MRDGAVNYLSKRLIWTNCLPPCARRPACPRARRQFDSGKQLPPNIVRPARHAGAFSRCLTGAASEARAITAERRRQEVVADVIQVESEIVGQNWSRSTARHPKFAGERVVSDTRRAPLPATSQRMGRFELADGGTIFLDEIGDMRHDCRPTAAASLRTGVPGIGSNTELTPIRAFWPRPTPFGGGGQGRPFPRRFVLALERG